MQTLAHYALLGSLLAGATGAIVLAAVTFKHGIKRTSAGAEKTPEDAARHQRLLRLADTVAVLCFAVSAGLGVMGLMQQTRGASPAMAAADDGTLAERLSAIERRVAASELELQARNVPPAELRAWEERLARLETRVGAVEERAAVAERRSLAAEQLVRGLRDERARTTPAAVPRRTPTAAVTAPAVPAAKKSAPASSASPRLAPRGNEAPMMAPEASASPRIEPSASIAMTTPTAATAPREPAPRRVEAASQQEPSLGEKLRGDWETVKRQARRGGEDWRDGWEQIKRLFGN